MEREDFLAAEWEGLLEGMKATTDPERNSAITAAYDDFPNIIVLQCIYFKNFFG